MKKFISLFLVITAVMLPQFHRFAFAEEQMSNEQLLYILKNDDALLETRKTVVNELMESLTDEHRVAILEALKIKKTTDSAKLFRAYLEQKILAKGDKEILASLKSALESSGDAAFRMSALAVLWNANPKSISYTIIKIIQNSSEPDDLRLAALERIAFSEEYKDEALALTRRILTTKTESLLMRRACIGFLETRIPKEETHKIYQDIILNSAENTDFRRFLVMKGVYLHIPDYPQDLIKIVKDSRNAISLRQTALQGLNLAGDSAAQFLPELRRLESVESDAAFKENLKSFIEQVEKR